MCARRHFHAKTTSAKLYKYIGVGERDLYIDETHTALNIFRFAVFFFRLSLSPSFTGQHSSHVFFNNLLTQKFWETKNFFEKDFFIRAASRIFQKKNLLFFIRFPGINLTISQNQTCCSWPPVEISAMQCLWKIYSKHSYCEVVGRERGISTSRLKL